MSPSIELAPLRSPQYASFLTEDGPLVRHPHSPRPIFSSPPPDLQDGISTSLASIHPLWKRNLHALLEHPKSSPPAFLLHMTMLFLILFSALVTVLETVPAFHAISTKFWFGIETTLVAIFTVEYVARCFAWSGTWMSLLKWQTSFFGIIDLLAVAPYYIELAMHQDTSVLFRFSILRMFRLLRVFKPFRYNNTILLTIEVMYVSVRRSQHALLAIGFFVVMILTIFSTLLYFAERGTWDPILEAFVNVDGDPTQFSSIPAAAWFVIVTITTVGYGEITPRSFLGRLITLPILMFGLLLITLPSFVLGREFSLVWERMTSRRGQDGDPHIHDHDHDLDSPVDTPFHFPFAPHPHFPPSPMPSSSAHTMPPTHAAHTHTQSQSYVSGHQHIPYTPTFPQDLSNRKLAHNQTELSRQINELRATVETQGILVRRLVGLLEGKGKEVDRS